jgi:hypothetical protein
LCLFVRCFYYFLGKGFTQMALINFNAADHQDAGPGPLPAGDFMVYVAASEMRINQDNGNQSLSLTLDVMQPETMQGRKVFSNYTMSSHNEEAVRIGMQQLAQVCRAVGVMSPSDSTELHDIPFFVRLIAKQLDSGKVVNNVQTCWSTASAAPPLAKPKGQPPKPAGQQYAQAPAQAWQQPQQQPQYAPPVQQVPQQQHMDLQTQYRTQPPAQQYQPQPMQQQPMSPPWAQPRPAQQPQQQHDPNGDVPFNGQF